jgi:ribosomal protein S27AE
MGNPEVKVPPPGLQNLGFCPKCKCSSIDNPHSGKYLCSDCGYTEYRNNYYCTPETLPNIIKI